MALPEPWLMNGLSEKLMSESPKKLKKKLGRRLLREQPLTEQLNVRLTQNDMEILRNYCWRHDVSASHVIRDSLAILGVIPDWVSNKD